MNPRQIIPGIETYPDLERQFKMQYSRLPKGKSGCKSGGCSQLNRLVESFRNKLQKQQNLGRLR